MSVRAICFWPADTTSKRSHFFDSISRSWLEKVPETLFLQVGLPGENVIQADAFIARFSQLPPKLFENYVRGTASLGARLSFDAWPTVENWQILMRLIETSFKWIVVSGIPKWDIATLAMLDQCEQLVWCLTDVAAQETVLTPHLEELARRKYPNTFSTFILDPQRDVSPPPTLCCGLPIERVLPVRDQGPRVWLEAVEKVCEDFQQVRQSLPRSHQMDDADAVISEARLLPIKQALEPLLREAVHRAGASSQNLSSVAQATVDRYFAERPELAISREERQHLYTRVMEDVLGLGPLEKFLKDPAVSEIMVCGTRPIFIEKGGKLEESGMTFHSEQQLRTVLDRIVAPIGRRVDESMPLCDARLLDGSRVNIVLPPLALDGAALTIRKFMKKKLSLDEFIPLQSLTFEMAQYLKSCVLARKNIVISGGTGSGKTTLLNALSGLIPDSERIITIEDAAELQLQKPHVIRMESRPANAEGHGAVTIRSLVVNALRMRPDRIVIGECRGGEALDMLQAMNTGHDGSLTTLHANTPRDAIGRLETLVLLSGIDLPVRVVREQIRGAVHVIVQQSRLSDGSRKITSITEVTGMEGDTLTLQELFRFKNGTFESTGLRSHFQGAL